MRKSFPAFGLPLSLFVIYLFVHNTFLTSEFLQALNDKSSLVIRESAATAIIAAQLVLRDETHLFALLDGLADDKKNLLTYLFDKHGTMGSTLANGSGMEKLEKEMRRLDNRTNASPRPAK